MIELDTENIAKTLISEVGEGNPGGITVCWELFQLSRLVDTTTSAISPLVTLSALSIKGSRIWVLFKDCCSQDITVMLEVLLLVQNGSQTGAWLNEHIDASRPFDLTRIHNDC